MPAGGILDRFDGMDACAPWGRSTEGNATVALGNVGLEISLGTAMPAQGACTEFLSTQLSEDGALLELGTVSAAPSAYVMLAVVPESRSEINAQLLMRATRVDLLNDGAAAGMLAVDVAGVSALRLRPAPDRSAMIGEVRISDVWHEVGTIAGAAPGPAFLTFGAGTTAAEPAPSTTSFDSVRMCAAE